MSEKYIDSYIVDGVEYELVDRVAREKSSENENDIETLKNAPETTQLIQVEEREVERGERIPIEVPEIDGAEYKWFYSLEGKQWYSSSMTGATTRELSVLGNNNNNGRYFRCRTTKDGKAYHSGVVKITVTEKTTVTEINLGDYAQANGTDQATEIQAALDAAAGGTLMIPSGTFRFAKTLKIKGNTRVIGNGSESILKVIGDGTALDLMFWRSEAQNEDGTGTYDDHKVWIFTDGDYITLENFAICGTGFVYQNVNTALRVSGKNHVLRNIEIYDVDMNASTEKGYGCHIFQASRVMVENCHMHHCGYEALGLEDCRNVEVIGGEYTDCKKVNIQIHRRTKDAVIQGIVSERGTTADITLHGVGKKGEDDRTLERIYISDSYLENTVHGVQGGEHDVHFYNCFVGKNIYNEARCGDSTGWTIQGCTVDYVRLYGSNHMVCNNIMDTRGISEHLVQFGTTSYPSGGGCMARDNIDARGKYKYITVDGVKYYESYPAEDEIYRKVYEFTTTADGPLNITEVPKINKPSEMTPMILRELTMQLFYPAQPIQATTFSAYSGTKQVVTAYHEQTDCTGGIKPGWFMDVKPRHGFWHSEFPYAATKNCGGAYKDMQTSGGNYEYLNSVSTYKVIDKITSDVNIPAGTRVVIWGVG